MDFQGKTTEREKEKKVLEGEGNERLDLDKWEKGSQGGELVSKSIQGTALVGRAREGYKWVRKAKERNSQE